MSENLLDEAFLDLLRGMIWDANIIADVDASKERNNQTDKASFDEIQQQREAEPHDMRLLGNLGRLFINEVVDPIMAMSWEVAEDTPGGSAEDRSYHSYLKHVNTYATVLYCEQNPSPYNDLGLRHLRRTYDYDIVGRMERVDRALFPVTGVNVLELGLAEDAYRRHTMHAWTCEYSNHPNSLDKFLTECERCQWRDEWRDLGTKMTRTVRAKLDSNRFQSQKVYCDDPNR